MKSIKMNLTGWGNYHKLKTNGFKPANIDELKKIIKSKNKNDYICRGLGRSYGDSSLNNNILILSNFRKFLKINPNRKEIECSSNYSLKDLINILLKKRFFLKVTSGTKYVTIGGAIASDIHGKNHHKDGSFCDYVKELKILIHNGKIITCSRIKNKDLFHATCAGMGLTGIIISAKISVFKIDTQNIKETIIKTNNLNDTIKAFKDYNESKYIVAWLDTNSKKKYLGRSIIFIGDHLKKGENIQNQKNRISIPFEFPNFIINKFVLKLLSKIFYFKHPKYCERIISLNEYFYPLDKIDNWNRIYGKDGFVQIQILLKNKNIHKNLKKIIFFFQKEKQVSFLSTLKKLGKKNENLLSFPDNGFTITFDIKNNTKLTSTHLKLEKILKKMNGKIYMTKDTLMTEQFFKKSYKNYNKFVKIKKKYDPNSKFMSYQSKRLGIC